MKYYDGMSEDDKPINGGKYIDENGEGSEIYNFTCMMIIIFMAL